MGSSLSCLHTFIHSRAHSTQLTYTFSFVGSGAPHRTGALYHFHEYRTNLCRFSHCRPDKTQRRMHHMHGLSWLCKLAFECKRENVHCHVWNYLNGTFHIGHLHFVCNKSKATVNSDIARITCNEIYCKCFNEFSPFFFFLFSCCCAVDVGVLVLVLLFVRTTTMDLWWCISKGLLAFWPINCLRCEISRSIHHWHICLDLALEHGW